MLYGSTLTEGKIQTELYTMFSDNDKGQKQDVITA